ncbi:C4-type zinc finger protein, DksA/TraR family [Collimonas fungivorans Ter331]|uniref:RNA polymerase-binding transcription factor DksA n=1 Tax=Collimonas fungivorans (strain Ter331) TaxID=1005048 RepID=G0AE14_COLFT|nr:C4-type zinc finger protein, DksA/TraR family [Collimonas fungivorans Ter331]
MNLTVKKTVAKKASASLGKSTPKARQAAVPASSTVKKAVKSAVTGVAKSTVAAKSAKLSAKAPRKTETPVATASKAVSKVAKPDPKPVVKSLAKKTAIAKSSSVAAADKAARNTQASSSVTTKLSSPTARSGASSTSDKPASAGLTDKIEKNVVSKASEVATKTTKPTSDSILLTEEQILKMGEKDYMNEAQLAFFKARLQQLEIDLLKNAGETTEHLRETVLVPDPADRATIEEEHALELRTRDRERKLLKKVQQSIASIDAGEYGWCEETGEPIGIPRLLARPTATLSLEAQQRRELKQKLYGD